MYFSIENFRDMLYAKSDCIDRSTKHVCSWERGSFDDITSYKEIINSKLESCIYDYDVIYCNDIHCNNDVQRAQINNMCSTIISICLSASAKTIPRARPQCKIVPGWNEKVKDALDTSQFWYGIGSGLRHKTDGRSYLLYYETRSISISLCSTGSQKENN